MRVEIVYAVRDAADVVTVQLQAGATVRDAIAASGIADRHPGVALDALGVHGRRVSADTRLADGDRVEIYRPLLLDPKERRRQRAARRDKRGDKGARR
jgi:putative ubiquitin-RnfH superfamily antitoxin RatB of RatAB toxin-antitoxin module